MSWEIKTPEQILEITGGRGVTGPLEGAHTTDDWNLTDACARSLIRRERFDLLDIALLHIAEMEKSSRGWGRTTIQAVTEMRDYLYSRGKTGRSPYDGRAPAKPGKGRGNGVAMKMSPFVLWAVCSNIDLFEKPDPDRPFHLPDLMDQLLLLGRMTHPDLQASIAACGLAIFLGSVMLEHPSVMTGSMQERASWLLAQTIDQVSFMSNEDGFKSQLQKLLDFDLLFGHISLLRQEIGTSPDALESVPFSLAVFLRHPEDFRLGILEAVNAGGDTDTIASMVGALIGANVGSEGIPPEWKKSSMGEGISESALIMNVPRRHLDKLVRGIMSVNDRTSEYRSI
jgi:poly(ADP-ribose) glycohydrolase ARH3